MLQAAKNACDWSKCNDNWELAAAHLGQALHALQDWVAHGDFNTYQDAPLLLNYRSKEAIYYWHNWNTPFSVSQYWPDNPNLDASSPDGRPTYSALGNPWTLSNNDVVRVCLFTSGKKRIDLTAKLTVDVIVEFMDFVDDHSIQGGQCKDAFLS